MCVCVCVRACACVRARVCVVHMLCVCVCVCYVCVVCVLCVLVFIYPFVYGAIMSTFCQPVLFNMWTYDIHVLVHGPGLSQHAGSCHVDACIGRGQSDPVSSGLCQPHEQVYW